MKENLKGCLIWIVGFLIVTFIGASLGFIDSESLKDIDLFSKIKEEAYNEGFIDGRAEGREESLHESDKNYDAGYEAGFADGAKDSSSAYEDGYVDGYAKGYSEGKAAGTSSGTQSSGSSNSSGNSNSSGTSNGSGTFSGSGGNTYYGPIAEECDYVLNKSTKKFHKPSCSSATNIKLSNREYFTGTREAVIARGFEPCKRCNP